MTLEDDCGLLKSNKPVKPNDRRIHGLVLINQLACHRLNVLIVTKQIHGIVLRLQGGKSVPVITISSLHTISPFFFKGTRLIHMKLMKQMKQMKLKDCVNLKV